MRVAAVVCPNGIGHLRRTLAVLDRVLERRPDARIDLVADVRAVDRLRDTASARRVLERAEVHGGVVDPGVTWSRDPASYRDGRLLAWIDRVAASRAVREADLVVSDNLAGVLEVRRDAVLLGSFLWSDVLEAAHPREAAVADFVARERAILAETRPPMIGLELLAMPGVCERTRFVGVGFVAPAAHDVIAAAHAQVAVVGGRTGAADDVLAVAARALLDAGIAITGDPDPSFGYEPRDFASCAAVVCRPGIGTISDCVAQRVPMVFAYEPGNVELAHNAARLHALGAGLDLGTQATGSDVLTAVRGVLAPERAAAMRAALAGLKCDGANESAEALLQLFVGRPESKTMKRNGNGIDWLCVARSAPLTEVIRRFEGATERGLPAGVALVVDGTGRLEGTVTDGDIRRALLRREGIETTAGAAMHKNPITFSEHLSYQSIIRRLPIELERRGRRGRKFLGKIILVDDDGRPARVLDYHQLWEQRVATHRHVVVVGLGYVGLTLALELAEEGFRVTGVDVDAGKIAGLARGESHVHEQGLPELLREQLKQNFRPATAVPDDGDVFVISVGTPVASVGGSGAPQPQLEILREACRLVGGKLGPGALVVLRSTVPVGTTREVVAPLLEEVSGLRAGKDFHLAFAPERTVEGKALQELRELPQIIGGINEDSVEATVALFRELTPTMVRVESLEAAEMAKLINNSFRDLIFAFANEIARVSSVFNLDAVELIRAANRGYPRDPVPLPSPGVGGPCLTKDPYILGAVASRAGLATTLAHLGRATNESMHEFVADAVVRELRALGKDPAQSTVLVCGLAFKGRPETGDIRNSTSLEIAKLLSAKVGRVLGHDPVVPAAAIAAEGLTPAELPGALRESDAVLFLNNHRSYEKLDPFALARSLRGPGIVYDAWRLFRADDILGACPVVYMGLGFVRRSPSLG